MKKYLIVCSALLALCGFGFAGAAYQEQGFSQYADNGSGTVGFWCESTCIMLLGDKGANDMVSIDSGSHQGTGSWGYGYLVGGKVYPGALVPAAAIPDTYSWSFADDQTSPQLPGTGVQIVFLVLGPLQASRVHIAMTQRTFGQTLSYRGRTFWSLEKIAPYSINLHYGPKIGTMAWPMFGLIVMIITLIVLYLTQKKLTVGNALRGCMTVLIIVAVIGGTKGLIDNIKITNGGVQKYSVPAVDQKTFFDLGDYITVTDKVRTFLHLDNVAEQKGKECAIYAKSNMSWPFDAHRASVYLRPCQVVQTGSLADYLLYYNIPTDAELTGSLVLTGNDFALFDNSTR